MRISIPRKCLGCSILLLSLAVGVSVGQTQTLGLDDLGDISSVSSPRIAPDGKSIVIVVSQADYEENRYESRLVLVDVATGDARNLTHDRSTVHHPRWSPSGDRVAFIAADTRNGEPLPQVFVLPMGVGEARVATAAPQGVVQFEWSADGNSIFYIGADVPAEEPEGPQRHNKSFVVGHHDYLATARPPALHVWEVSVAGGEARRINGDDVVAAGGQALWLTVSPDGSAIAFFGYPSDRPGDFHRSALLVIDLQTGEGRSFGEELHVVGWGGFSPDGSRLAYSSTDNRTRWFDAHHIFVADADGGRGEKVTGAIDRNFWDALWMPDGTSLLVYANDAARVSLWRQPLSGEPEKLGLGTLDPVTADTLEADVGKNGEIAFVATEPQRPTELYWLDSIGASPRRLTDYNAKTAALDLGRVEEITWQGPDGFAENGVLIYPPDFDVDRRYPLVLSIHGGPMYATTTAFNVLGQLLAARGFVVFGPNYRGSDNLGGRYQSAVIHDAGAGPGRDVMAGLEAVKKLGFVDESRIGVSGWSYGGYMTTWLIGNYPDVWWAAVAGAAVTDYVDSYALSDLNTAFAWGFDKHPWSPIGQSEWRDQSPIAHVHRATTPTLILCNTGDLRVPIVESYKLYHALDDMGVPVEFVAYPVPGHFPGDPVHRDDIYRRLGDWMERRFELPRDAPAR